jgi:murein DD-endopeptidase MepM/ murein hydrolase activator NlpD
MNIILIASQSARTRKLTLRPVHFVVIAGAFLMVTITMALAMNYVSFRYADKVEHTFLRALVVHPQQERHLEIQSHLSDNLNIMAAKLGQMQAQLLRLDALGERLAESTGIQSHEFMFNQPPGQGGASSALPVDNHSFEEFNQMLHELSHALDDRTDKLSVLDALLRRGRLEKRVLPSAMPVDTEWYSSGFGYRIDPFTGRRAFHEGVDFAAITGTPIKAAAGGIVVYSDHHPNYGNMVEIDHGGDLVSRYAHASKRLVKIGEVVTSGQKIAEVGSTGRSTGPHLHFEIRHKGVPKNPSLFLEESG